MAYEGSKPYELLMQHGNELRSVQDDVLVVGGGMAAWRDGSMAGGGMEPSCDYPGCEYTLMARQNSIGRKSSQPQNSRFK